MKFDLKFNFSSYFFSEEWHHDRILYFMLFGTGIFLGFYLFSNFFRSIFGGSYYATAILILAALLFLSIFAIYAKLLIRRILIRSGIILTQSGLEVHFVEKLIKVDRSYTIGVKFFETETRFNFPFSKLDGWIVLIKSEGRQYAIPASWIYENSEKSANKIADTLLKNSELGR